MEGLIGLKEDWKAISNADEAKMLIDYGIVIKWKDMKYLKKVLPEDEQKEVIEHLVVRLAERADNRLSAEIITESLLIWMAQSTTESSVFEMIKLFFEQPGFEEACRLMVDISLTSEIVENTHDEDIFATAVAIICQLGVAIRAYDSQHPNDLDDAKGLLDHIATYLLSVSNTNNNCIRLSLLHYFGESLETKSEIERFNKIISRFGHTVLDHLFSLLFHKRTEAVSLQYLMENLPAILKTNYHGQRILHETFKYYMLKHPERFGLFLQVFTDHIIKEENQVDETVRKGFLQHLGLLLRVVAGVNHKVLARELTMIITKYPTEWREEIASQLLVDGKMKSVYLELLKHMTTAKEGDVVPDSIIRMRSTKRGRKPSFARANGLAPLDQINYLGGAEVPKAS